MRSCRFYLYIHKLIEDNEKHLIRYSNGALTTIPRPRFQSRLDAESKVVRLLLPPRPAYSA